MKKRKSANPPNLNESDLKRYGRWIPGEIYYNPIFYKSRSRIESLLFGLIISLCENKKGVCTASNAYLARDLKVKSSTLQKALKKLEDEGYIIRSEIRDERRMVVERRIMIDQNYKALYREMLIKEIELRELRR